MLGDKIKKLRIEKRLTQQELANILDLGQSTIGMIESGKRTVGSKETLIKLADFFNVSLDYLLTDEEEEKPINKINTLIKESGINTIAAHFEGEEFTEDDIEDIENFIKYVLSKKKK